MAYQEALAGHREVLRDAVASHAGREVDCRADELLACFRRASEAIAAQLELTAQGSQLRVRWLGSATLLGSPARPRIACRLLIGSERPAAAGAGLNLVCPRGVAGGAHSCVVLAPKSTRRCRR
jgi:class 3 adenylate cyclase